VEFSPSSFFSEQLTAFELWLAHGSADKKPPEQLPIVLQVRTIRFFFTRVCLTAPDATDVGYASGCDSGHTALLAAFCRSTA
jgi:hypothetical protein